MSGTRNYFVPKAVSRAAASRLSADSLHAAAISAATSGKVRGFHLPLLASGGWPIGSEWAAGVMEKEKAARERRAQTLLAAAGYDPRYTYQGVLDSSYPDHELIVSVARSEGYDSPLEKWDGLDWGVTETDPDGLEYVVLDQDVLVDVLDAINTGSAGVMLRPFEPKAWVRDCAPLDLPVLASAGPPRNTGVMVALRVSGDTAEQLSLEDEGGVPIDDMHVTLAYLGDMEEDAIDYQALHHAVARWVRRVPESLTGTVSGPGQFTADEEPVAVALVDIPALPETRELLVRLLETSGVPVRKDHGYTPHITLAYGPGYEGVTVPNVELEFEYAVVHYGDDVQEYPFGQPVVAAGGAGPDVFYAIVDEFDTNAVLDVIRVIPGPVAYRRVGGAWVKDEKILMRLMGVDPPPVTVVPPEQAEDVLAQVDAYDKEHPEEDPVTAAAVWDEKKYKRDGGKFAKKDGSPAGTKAKVAPRGPKRPTSGPKRPGAGTRPAAVAPGRKRRSPYTAAQIQKEPWKLLSVGGDDNKTTLDLGLGEEFWSKQPDGFREFARRFLRKKEQEAAAAGGAKKDGQTKESDDGKNEEGERKGESGDGKRDVAEGDQRSAAQVEAQKKAAARGGKKQGAANLAAWMKDVPPKYKQAMRDLVKAAAGKWGGGEGSAAQEGDGAQAPGGHIQPASDVTDRISKLDKADRDFDLSFAKEGLGEARQRELFDRQIAGAAERLVKTDANPQAIQRVLRHKVMEEKRRREAFERQRKLKAEQERVRRMAARNRESDLQAREGITADASLMPNKLKKFWLGGEGAAKIRWGTSGDFDRCTRALTKYLPTHMVKGACANLHKLATGTYPGKGRGH